MAATFSSMLSIKPEKFTVGHRPVTGYDYSSPFVVVSLPTTTRRRRRQLVVTTNCISNHTPDATKLRSSTDGMDILSQLPPDEPRRGVLILMEALQREGVTDIFTNKNQRLPLKTLSATAINTHVFLTHCSELSAASGYAMATGLPGVCMTSWLSAGLKFEFMRRLDYACKNGIPLLVMVVDGWEKEKEKNVVSATKTKDHGRRLDELIKCRLRITSAKDIPKIVRQALSLARSGRPGPVLIDHISYDSVHKLDIPIWDRELILCPPLLQPSRVQRPTRVQLEKVIGLLKESKRPLLLVNRGCFEWRKELTKFVELTGIPVFKDDTPVYLNDGSFILKHLSYIQSLESYSHFFIEHFDLLLALDTRSYCDEILVLRHSDSAILHFDVAGDCKEEEEGVEVDDEKSFPDVQPGSVSSFRCGDMKSMVERLNHLLEEGNAAGCGLDFSTWRREIGKANFWKHHSGIYFNDYVKLVTNDVANRGDTFIFTTQQGFRVRFWDWFIRGSLVHLRRGDYLQMTLPLSAGVAIGKCRRTSSGDDKDEIGTVIYISENVEQFIENIQELVVLVRNNIPVKVVIFNDTLDNDEFGLDAPDLVSLARSLGIPSARITKREEVREKLKVMMETPGPYVLDIILPHSPSISCFDLCFQEEDGQELYALDKEVDSFYEKWISKALASS